MIITNFWSHKLTLDIVSIRDLQKNHNYSKPLTWRGTYAVKSHFLKFPKNSFWKVVCVNDNILSQTYRFILLCCHSTRTNPFLINYVYKGWLFCTGHTWNYVAYWAPKTSQMQIFCFPYCKTCRHTTFSRLMFIKKTKSLLTSYS